MKTGKPIPHVKRDESVYQAKLVSLLRVTIQAPLARVIISATSIEEILAANLALEAEVLAIANLGHDLAEEQFQAIGNRHTKKFAASMAGLIPEIQFKLTDQTMKNWLIKKTNDNVSLIVGLNESQFTGMSKQMNKLVLGGEFDRQAVAKAAQKAFSASNSRAKLIGRDQVSKAFGELNAIRQKEVGITRYRWLTSGDGDRVRKTHQANNGRIFEWGDPPATGHPGDDPLCRCTAIPIID